MGRTNKVVETALSVANEKLKSTQNQKLQVQLIGMILHHHEAEMASAAKKYIATNGNAGRKSKSKQLPESPPSVNVITPYPGENKDLSDLRAQLKNQEQAVKDLRQEVTTVKKEAENDRKQINDLQVRLDFTSAFVQHLASALPANNRPECASELFHEFKTSAPELVAKLFETLGLPLEKWQAWDKHYAGNPKLMVGAFETPEKHEPGKLALLRLKLAELDIDVDAINAVRDYRDMKIDFDELKKRTGSYIQFDAHRVIKNTIRDDLMPRLSNEALTRATSQLDRRNDKVKKLQWLEVINELLEVDQPELGLGSCLLKEINFTRNQIL
jgi:molecular chaperone GrpE (heat shock protein)